MGSNQVTNMFNVNIHGIKSPHLPTQLVYSLKIGQFPSPFASFYSFQFRQGINISNDWIRTADLWCQGLLLYQLSHNYSLVYR